MANPIFFASGNVLRAVETGGWAFREGRRVGASVADDLAREPCNAPGFLLPSPIRSNWRFQPCCGRVDSIDRHFAIFSFVSPDAFKAGFRFVSTERKCGARPACGALNAVCWCPFPALRLKRARLPFTFGRPIDAHCGDRSGDDIDPVPCGER